ncbi:MAG: AsmA family protein, partial [Chitinophagaceae bacterium]|nr:AsmA family protein [Chitinophagaceae bacterium]
MKFLKITGIVLGVAITLLFLLPELFPGFVARKIKTFANAAIEGKLEFRKARLSVIRHFPSLTLSLVDFSLTGSAPFANDTLLAGKELAFGIDLRTLFSEKLSINQFFLTNALINIQVDSLGKANYNVVKENADTPPSPADTTGGATLRIERIIIKNSRLVYNDQSLPMLLTVKSLDYTGVGDLTKDVVDLESEIAGTDVSF